ncbi:MAG: C1 family peptidase [Anaerolineae bacterium]|nr:C1 family peptidase [Anaerolineae bacterium]
MARRKLIRQAVPVEELPSLSPQQAQQLKAHWIESAQELVAIAASPAGRQGLATALDVDDEQLDDIVKAARRQMPEVSSRRLLAAAEAVDRIQYFTGSIPPSPEQVTRARARSRFVTVAYPVDLPASVDHREKLPPIRNQAQRGTCVAHAAVAVREHMEIAAGAASTDINLSEQFVYWWCKENDGIPSVSGTYAELGLECMAKAGVPEEQHWPYNPNSIPGNEGQGPPPPAALDNAARFKIKRVIKLNPSRVLDLKTCLAEGKIICFAIPVFDSWYLSAAVKRYGKITMPLPGEEANGGHAMALVGYQDDEEAPGGGYFILRNSWQPWAYESAWGNGYGTIPYAYIENHCYAAFSADRLPKADVYIRDNPEDNGTVPSEGARWNSPDIWVRHAPDGMELHQNPIPGRPNYLYLRLHNRGAEARNVKAHVYICPLSPSIWPRNWQLLQTVNVPTVLPDAHLVVGPLEWQPEGTMLFCYLVRLESDEDPIQHDWSVQWDNNIAQKNLAVMDLAPGEQGTLRFVMHGIWRKISYVTLEVDRVGLPAGAKVELHTATRRLAPDSRVTGVSVRRDARRSRVQITAPTATLDGLEVRSSEKGMVTMKIALPEDARPGEKYEIVLTQRLGPLVIGKLSCLINVRQP